MHVNLIPVEMRLRMLARQRLRNWSIAWAILVLAGLCVLGSQYRIVCVSRNQLHSVEARTHSLREIQEQTSLLQMRLDTSRSELKTLHVIEPTDHSLALLMVLSSAAKSVGEPLQIQQLRLFNERTAPSSQTQTQPSGNKTPLEQSTLTLNGIAASDRALTQFVDALRRSPPLQQVELRSSSQWQAEQLNGRQFQVECRFEEEE